MSPTYTEPLVSWQPVAALFRLKQRAFWDAVKNLEIPHYRLNSRVIRFRISEVEKWLVEHRRGEA
jgi:predicted DNA-binding transcriptional regulator AlpA